MLKTTGYCHSFLNLTIPDYGGFVQSVESTACKIRPEWVFGENRGIGEVACVRIVTVVTLCWHLFTRSLCWRD